MIQTKEMIEGEMRRLKRINHQLIMWARAGDLEEVDYLLAEASINFKDTHGWTALMWATYRANGTERSCGNITTTPDRSNSS